MRTITRLRLVVETVKNRDIRDQGIREYAASLPAKNQADAIVLTVVEALKENTTMGFEARVGDNLETVYSRILPEHRIILEIQRDVK